MTTTLSSTGKLRGRPREFDMDAALDQALRVFSERGYHATSISELTEAMGLTSGSVYKAFKDKRGVFLAAFDRYRSVRLGVLRNDVSKAETGRDGLFAMLHVYANASHGVEGRRGCLVVNSATDMALFDEEAARRVAAAFETDERVMVDLIKLGQSDGSIRAEVDAEAVSRTLLCLMKGMRIVGKTDRSHAEMKAVAETAMKLLN
ncbi:TetR/AcrR family transcriptional regulator [Neorhizobium sp. P12A]|uniref:TetR/AcrR family transcriptional regulator n=1 Tax=Neorhizobium sp. P12A TaxID=2268027 RepID=UPI0011EECE80|nr:TetR/AcrR family transcriptional regulator [Neorhizobium sp. P12A]KAA0700272.1 TetR/AcrR family transcriptional regulator [Neorhizobium sp. P12A]